MHPTLLWPQLDAQTRHSLHQGLAGDDHDTADRPLCSPGLVADLHHLLKVDRPSVSTGAKLHGGLAIGEGILQFCVVGRHVIRPALCRVVLVDVHLPQDRAACS